MTTRTENITRVDINGVQLAYKFHGTGVIPLVMVHGALLTHQNWEWVVPHLPDSFRVLTYDRRGYGDSERPSGTWGIREHVADLAALIEHLEMAPAWVVGQSGGGNITLRLAGERPDLLRGITAHEPPLFSLVVGDADVAPMLEGFAQLNAAVAERIASGDHTAAAEQFIEEALGEGLWTQLPPWFRQITIENAPSYLDEVNDPEVIAFDLKWIRDFTRPVLLTQGDQSPPMFAPVISKLAEALPAAEVGRFMGAGHPVQVEQPEDYAEAITAFAFKNTA
jgi:pimeloyl-ACP methyl ester carboxylesterase